MKWTHYIAGMILAMTFMAACRHTSQTPLLTDAEAFLPAEPDSVDARLKQVDVRQLRGDEEEAKHLQHEMELLQDRQQALEDSQQKKAAVIKHLQRYIIERSGITTKLKDGASAHQMTPKDWQTVEQLLDEIDEGRISKIRTSYKDISKDDIHLCMMVRIGMSNPAIGHLFGITPSAVQHRKLTLKKKGFGIADPEVTLDKFLESL